MSAYLLRRDGGIYYFRRSIPLFLRPHVGGRREWVKSLGTKDRAEAKRLIPHLVIDTDRKMQDALAMAVGSSPLEGRNEISLAVPSLSPFVAVLKPSLPLLELFEGYAGEQRLKPSTALEWRSMLTKLIAFVRHNDAARLTVDDMDRWRDALLAETTKRGALRDPKTVKSKYLTAVCATLNWAVEKRKLSNNVASNIVVRAPRKAVLRTRDFTRDEVKTILSSTLTGPWLDADRFKTLARRWVPWLCAYSGARVNEISQLRFEDVYQSDGAWVIRITPEAGTVKSGITRVVPLHTHIIEQGFLQAIGSGRGPIFYDPTNIRSPAQHNRYYKKVGERLRDWIRLEIGITDPGVQPNHGWRHTFKTLALEAGIAERVTDFLQGHAPRTVGQQYGTVSLATLVAAVKAFPEYEIG